MDPDPTTHTSSPHDHPLPSPAPTLPTPHFPGFYPETPAPEDALTSAEQAGTTYTSRYTEGPLEDAGRKLNPLELLGGGAAGLLVAGPLGGIGGMGMVGASQLENEGLKNQGLLNPHHESTDPTSTSTSTSSSSIVNNTSSKPTVLAGTDELRSEETPASRSVGGLNQIPTSLLAGGVGSQQLDREVQVLDGGRGVDLDATPKSSPRAERPVVLPNDPATSTGEEPQDLASSHHIAAAGLGGAAAGALTGAAVSESTLRDNKGFDAPDLPTESSSLPASDQFNSKNSRGTSASYYDEPAERIDSYSSRHLPQQIQQQPSSSAAPSTNQVDNDLLAATVPSQTQSAYAQKEREMDAISGVPPVGANLEAQDLNSSVEQNIGDKPDEKGTNKGKMAAVAGAGAGIGAVGGYLAGHHGDEKGASMTSSSASSSALQDKTSHAPAVPLDPSSDLHSKDQQVEAILAGHELPKGHVADIKAGRIEPNRGNKDRSVVAPVAASEDQALGGHQIDEKDAVATGSSRPDTTALGAQDLTDTDLPSEQNDPKDSHLGEKVAAVAAGSAAAGVAYTAIGGTDKTTVPASEQSSVVDDGITPRSGPGEGVNPTASLAAQLGGKDSLSADSAFYAAPAAGIAEAKTKSAVPPHLISRFSDSTYAGSLPPSTPTTTTPAEAGLGQTSYDDQRVALPAALAEGTGENHILTEQGSNAPTENVRTEESDALHNAGPAAALGGAGLAASGLAKDHPVTSENVESEQTSTTAHEEEHHGIGTGVALAGAGVGVGALAGAAAASGAQHDSTIERSRLMKIATMKDSAGHNRLHKKSLFSSSSESAAPESSSPTMVGTSSSGASPSAVHPLSNAATAPENQRGHNQTHTEMVSAGAGLAGLGLGAAASSGLHSGTVAAEDFSHLSTAPANNMPSAVVDSSAEGSSSTAANQTGPLAGSQAAVHAEEAGTLATGSPDQQRNTSESDDANNDSSRSRQPIIARSPHMKIATAADPTGGTKRLHRKSLSSKKREDLDQQGSEPAPTATDDHFNKSRGAEEALGAAGVGAGLGAFAASHHSHSGSADDTLGQVGAEIPKEEYTPIPPVAATSHGSDVFPTTGLHNRNHTTAIPRPEDQARFGDNGYIEGDSDLPRSQREGVIQVPEVFPSTGAHHSNLSPSIPRVEDQARFGEGEVVGESDVPLSQRNPVQNIGHGPTDVQSSWVSDSVLPGGAHTASTSAIGNDGSIDPNTGAPTGMLPVPSDILNDPPKHSTLTYLPPIVRYVDNGPQGVQGLTTQNMPIEDSAMTSTSDPNTHQGMGLGTAAAVGAGTGGLAATLLAREHDQHTSSEVNDAPRHNAGTASLPHSPKVLNLSREADVGPTQPALTPFALSGLSSNLNEPSTPSSTRATKGSPTITPDKQSGVGGSAGMAGVGAGFGAGKLADDVFEHPRQAPLTPPQQQDMSERPEALQQEHVSGTELQDLPLDGRQNVVQDADLQPSRQYGSGNTGLSDRQEEKESSRGTGFEQSPHMKIATRKDSIGHKRLHKKSISRDSKVAEPETVANRDQSSSQSRTEGEGMWNDSVANVVESETISRGGQRPGLVTIDSEDKRDHIVDRMAGVSDPTGSPTTSRSQGHSRMKSGSSPLNDEPPPSPGGSRKLHKTRRTSNAGNEDTPKKQGILGKLFGSSGT